MVSKVFPLLLLIIFSVFFPAKMYAQAEHVLPYPSAMPGSKAYTLFTLWDEMQRYWHFGSLSQFRYNLKQSDKYIVEARVLFEYKQYLLADRALKNSDKYFDQAALSLDKASKEKKNIRIESERLVSAASKHREVLMKIRESTPEEFLWSPEDAAGSTLQLQNSIDKAIVVRERRI